MAKTEKADMNVIFGQYDLQPDICWPVYVAMLLMQIRAGEGRLDISSTVSAMIEYANTCSLAIHTLGLS